MKQTPKLSRVTRRISKISRAVAPIVIATLLTRVVPSMLASASGVESAPAAPGSTPVCHTVGTHNITISCEYFSVDLKSAASAEPRIALNHAAFSFKTKHDNWMSVALTFTNLGGAPPSEVRSVYLAIDDDSGKNYIRRVLPHVDFRNLAPGQKTAFSEHLLIPALHPGHYRIELWIPSSDPSLKFDVSHNFLLESDGVADRKTGLNRVASFSVVH
jgi:hypothetical protein